MKYNKKPTLLYLDDDDMTLNVYNRSLGKDYVFIKAKTPQDFRYAIANNNVDIVIVDIAIRNEVNGLDLTKELRSNSKYKDLPIICVSAYVTHSDREAAEAAGVTSFFSKPVMSKDLVSEIENCLSEKNI
jgi:DNA-binding NtrC family response regulator